MLSAFGGDYGTQSVTLHPHWCREMLPEEGMDLAMFRNAIDFARSLK